MNLSTCRKFQLLAAAVCITLFASQAILTRAVAQDAPPPAEPTKVVEAADEPALPETEPVDEVAEPAEPVAEDSPVADEPPADATPADEAPVEAKPADETPVEAAPADAADDLPAVEPMPAAQLTTPLAKQAIAAKEKFQAIAPEQVKQARSETQQAAATLEKIFIRGDDLYEKTWKEFLHWDDLQAGLTTEKPDYQALTAVYDQFRVNIQGNELKKFTTTRDALQRYLNLSFAADQPNLEANYGQILDRLATLLQKQADAPSTDNSEEIGRLVGWLNRYEQAPDLTKAIAAQYSQPNLFAEVSQAFVATGLRQDVNRPTNVYECILGTSIRGNGFTIGSTTVDLLPSDTQARMNLILSGVTNTTNVGVNGPVNIYSTAQTSFNARLPLMFDANGLTAGSTSASADSKSQITGIGAKHRIVRKIASKKIAQGKPQAERIASGKAATRVASELSKESVGLVLDANNNFNDKFRDPLIRRGAYPRELQFRTDPERIYVQSLKDGPDQLAAFSPPPALSGKFDMAVRFHESAVSNYAEEFIGGETLTDEKLVKMIKDSGREVPEELKITPESDPWSITFASDQPVSVRFSQNTVKISIRGRRFTRQDQAITKAAAISANYRVEKTATGAKLVREGDVEVEYLSRGRQNFAETAFKPFLKNKFEAMFKPEFEFTGLQLPGRFADVGAMQLEQLHVDDSWAALGWLIPE